MSLSPLELSDFQKIPFSIRVQLGLTQRKIYATNKFGYNAAVGTSYEDIWSPGGSISFLSAADTMDVVSTDAADKGTPTAGTGARTVRLIGLNSTYDPLVEDVTLNGTTPVVTTNEFLRVYRAFILTTGTGGVNAGNINITDTTGSSQQAQIEASRGQTAMAIFTVRNGYKGLITGVNLAVGGADSAEVELRTISSSGVSRIREIQNLGTGNNIQINYVDFAGPIVIDSKNDILVRAKKTGAGGNTSVSATFTLYEFDEDEFNP